MLKKLFISYCSKDSCIADIIDDSLQSQLKGIVNISRDTRDVAYKESFKKFMNSINLHDFVLCIVSDSYLKSVACMYEVGEILKNHTFTKKLLFVVLSEEERSYYLPTYKDSIQANIYDPIGRLEYVEYWQKQYDKLKSKIDEIMEYESKREAIDDLAIIKSIKDFDIAPFMSYLSDANGKNFSKLKANDFSEIISIILPEYEKGIFERCKTFEEILKIGIRHLQKLSMTDYNQIILYENFNKHTTGLIVVADIISGHKQHYREVAVDGLISKAFRKNELINIDDVNTCADYFTAVSETKSELIVPIWMGRACIGVINVESNEKSHFNIKLQNQIVSLANALGNAFLKMDYNGFGIEKIPYVSLFYKE